MDADLFSGEAKPRRVRDLLRSPCRAVLVGASDPDVRQHHRARPYLGSRRQRGQKEQALGRSRGGFSTKVHLKTDFDGHPIAIDLTGGEKGTHRISRSCSILDPTSIRGRPSPTRATPATPTGRRHVHTASSPSFRARPTRKASRASSQRTSTKKAHVSSRPSASSSASNASLCDARRLSAISHQSSRSQPDSQWSNPSTPPRGLQGCHLLSSKATSSACLPVSVFWNILRI